MRTSIVTAFLIALGLSAVAAATLYARPAQGADAGPKLDAVSGPAAPTTAAKATPASSTPVAAPAPVAAPTPTDWLAFLGAAVTAAKGAKWLALIALLIVGLVAFIRRENGWIIKKVPWLGTDRGGASLALLLGGLTEFGAALAPGGTGAPPGAVTALVTALAAGGRAILKGFLFPQDKAAAGA